MPPLEYITPVGFYPKTKEYGEVITAMLNEQGFQVSLTVLRAGGVERAALPSPRRRPRPHGRLRLVDRLARAGPGAAHALPFVVAPHLPASRTRTSTPALDKERSAPTLEDAQEARAAERDTMPLIASQDAGALALHLGDDPRDAERFEGLYIYPDGSMDASKSRGLTPAA